MFYESHQTLEKYHEVKEISDMRDRFATTTFIKRSFSYFAFLIILTTGKVTINF